MIQYELDLVGAMVSYVDEPLAACRVVDSGGEVPVGRDCLDFEPLVG